MSELSTRSGLPVATIKFYLREGLLHPGSPTAATQAQYDDAHVRRLRLVRALTDVAGLRLDAVRAVLTGLDDPDRTWHQAIGAARARIPSTTVVPTSALARARACALVERRGWTVHPDGPHTDALARALDARDDLGQSPGEELLDVYASAAEAIADHEVAAVPGTDPAAAAECVVVGGTLLLEPVLLSIRRMAQEATYRTRA